jgi:hypothetical protein
MNTNWQVMLYFNSEVTNLVPGKSSYAYSVQPICPHDGSSNGWLRCQTRAGWYRLKLQHGNLLHIILRTPLLEHDVTKWYDDSHGDFEGEIGQAF